MVMLACAGFAQEPVATRASCPSTLGDSQVIFIGDVHSDPVIKENLTLLLPCLKGLGITHLALEMFRDTEGARGALEEYHRTGQNEDRVFRFLKSDWPWMPELYLDVIRGAKKNGIKALAMDAPARAGQDAREQHMSLVITRIIAAEPQAKVLVLVGAYHAGPDRLPALLTAAGLSTSILSISQTAK
ncbi:MAG: ChaN family lipoprotein [Elusimicrobia bacterium]|nr:ChaN family lipoprotein [Elusimicrobiota bacterium]